MVTKQKCKCSKEQEDEYIWQFLGEHILYYLIFVIFLPAICIGVVGADFVVFTIVSFIHSLVTGFVVLLGNSYELLVIFGLSEMFILCVCIPSVLSGCKGA